MALFSVTVFLLILSCFGANYEEELGSPLRIAQCRATCLERFTKESSGDSVCLQQPDCFMCWGNCELLQSNFPVWGAMCTEKAICFPGCQEACKFHYETSSVQQSQPVIHTRGDQLVELSETEARWPRPTSPGPEKPLVYVVMRREENGWKQVTQTIDLKASIPSNSTSVRILVVDNEGLVTIYSPMVSPPASIASDSESESAGRKNQAPGQRKKINTEIIPTTKSTITPDWQLEEVSLIHQKVLVIAEIAWQPRVSRGVYLVTWEVDGGGLKGNLFTDSICVTLSLWPDTIYHIQVELVSHSANHMPETSNPLVIDTHRADFPRQTSLPTPSDITAIRNPLVSVLVHKVINERRSFNTSQLIAGSGAAVILFLFVIVAALFWRWRNSREAAKGLVDEEIGPSPVITLVPEKYPCKNWKFGASESSSGSRGLRNHIPIPEGLYQSTIRYNTLGNFKPESSYQIATPFQNDVTTSPQAGAGTAEVVNGGATTSAFLEDVEKSAQNEVQV